MNGTRNTGIRTAGVTSRFLLEEQYVASKTGKLGDCEDATYYGRHFAAVIDGVTAKTTRRWRGQTGGKLASMIITKVLARTPLDATARETIDLMTDGIRSMYERYGLKRTVEADPSQRIAASCAIVSFRRNEVWLVGDCQALLGDQHVSNFKRSDALLSEVRAFYLQAALADGADIEVLRARDIGREFIMPLLHRQCLFQNNPAGGDYWYAVIDGFAVPDKGIVVRSVPDTVNSIILATDGYPAVRPSLQESEAALLELTTDDPLLIRRYKSTKGVETGCESFDDRAYLKLRVFSESQE